MRYRLQRRLKNGDCWIVDDQRWSEQLPLVHVFRDDELDSVVADAIVAGFRRGYDDVDIPLVVEYLRNHGT